MYACMYFINCIEKILKIIIITYVMMSYSNDGDIMDPSCEEEKC